MSIFRQLYSFSSADAVELSEIHSINKREFSMSNSSVTILTTEVKYVKSSKCLGIFSNAAAKKGFKYCLENNYQLKSFRIHLSK